MNETLLNNIFYGALFYAKFGNQNGCIVHILYHTSIITGSFRVQQESVKVQVKAPMSLFQVLL